MPQRDHWKVRISHRRPLDRCSAGGAFAGSSVDDVAAALRSGAMKPSVPSPGWLGRFAALDQRDTC